MVKIPNFSSALKKRWWLSLELVVSAILVILMPLIVSPFLRPGIDYNALTLRIGSDALTLMGFIIASLAIVAKQIDKPAFDTIRTEQTFIDLWMTFGLTAIVLGAEAVMLRFAYVFIVADWFFIIANFLIIFSILLIADCVVLLLIVVSIVNEGRIKEFGERDPVEPTFPDDE